MYIYIYILRAYYCFKYAYRREGVRFNFQLRLSRQFVLYLGSGSFTVYKVLYACEDYNRRVFLFFLFIYYYFLLRAPTHTYMTV